MLADFFYAQMALQLEINFLQMRGRFRQMEIEAEERRRVIEENALEIERLRNEYDLKRGALIDLAPEDVREVPETKLIEGM